MHVLTRTVYRGCLVTALLVWQAFLPALILAHVGGHGPVPRSAAHTWTDPGTGTPVAGTLSSVAHGTVRVEDLQGRVHAWRVASLTPADRAEVERHEAGRARLLPRTLVPLARDGRTPGSTSNVPRAAWLGVAVLAGLCLSRRRRSRWRVVVFALVAIPIACGGKMTAPAAPSSATGPASTSTAGTTTSIPPASGTLSSYFDGFPQHVHAWQDAQRLHVESDGMADHVLMTGIRSWQQQVPLPQSYRGTNAWTIPLQPRLADQPVSARTSLFRGAIALAVNGVPIFNALNNRGDDAYLFGELDDFGGHSGRADDYHYHVAPLFLEAVVGRSRPIAVALDGFLLFGGTEPDGAPMRALDDYNGHADAATTYHYHGTRTYPYINGGLRGVVTVKDGQVDPQPVTTPIRPAGTPLNGATITSWAQTGAQAWRLEYSVAGRTSRVDYRVDGARYTFVFTDATGASRTETYDR